MGQISQKELDALIKAKIIDEPTALKISNYYLLQKSTSPGRFNTVLSILGALLAGLGIILFVAHNWDNLGGTAKTVLSFLPLILGQALCTYTLIRQKNVIAWREASASILFFAVGASLSLISQVYHIEGTLRGFLLTWILLVTPLVYIMRSSVVAMLVIAGITWYACLMGYASYPDQIPYAYLAIISILIPHYYQYFHRDPESNFFHLLNWFAVFSITIVLGCFGSNANNSYGWLFLAYLSLFCFFYFYGKTSRWHYKPNWTNPFSIVGLLGILVILFSWSFDFLWNDFLDKPNKSMITNTNFYLAIVFIIASAYLFIMDKEQKTVKTTDPTGLSFVPFFILLLFPIDWINLALSVINLWILLVAIYFINRGILANHLGILNFGLLLILILTLCRFFDDHIPFVWRGFFFLATGISFFAANYLLLKKRKKTISETI